ncbi:ABC transporter permease [Proteiniborus sp. MB09-C3]|uniref:ABC transporter permease n=1 Tax=Proteiniborus sp. MB09-C3 TaxID=3050072 RepID=UPI002552D794|nr:ABC transporter permease [Proteiniborus sp. MB09-C3]WIV11614.1 ABC transporter permease [Proteiniborus sp. MB09-C3]
MVNKQYQKRIEHRKLNSFQEYKTSTLAWGASLLLFLVIFLSSIDIASGEINYLSMAVSAVFLASGIIQYLVTLKVKKEILKYDDIKRSTRIIGYFLIPFAVTGNFFMAIAGFTLIKKEKTIEYTLCIYSILTSFTIMLISALNLFKEYVSNTFMLGMGVLLGITLFYVFTMLMVSKYVNGKHVDKKLIPVAIPLILSIFIGNVFAFILGLIIISKVRHKDEEISIEWIDVLRRLFRNYMSVLGMFVVTLLISLSICSYLTFDYSIAIDNNYSAILLSPSLEYPFGTDNYGRCVFTRIVFGARISLVVGLISTLVPIVIGGILGAVSGYYGKRVDNIIMRLLDVLYAVPGMLLAIAIVAAFGANTMNLILALSIGSIPMYARTVRATVMSIANQEFVEAAKACGAKDFTIIFKHILPNSMAPIIVRATLGIGGAVLSTSSLSYLGLGVEPHIPEWGNILKIGSAYLETSPYLAIFPGLAIILIVLAFNYFGDGLRDALDPKLK